MERKLCVADSVSDEVIHRAWNHLFGNNAIERIEHCESKKIIHLQSYYLETHEDAEAQDDLDELIEIYDGLEADGGGVICLQDPLTEWWIFGRVGAEYGDKFRFDIFFA
jgi:hypothetical protein